MLKLLRAFRTALPVHASSSLTCWGVMKPCEVREAKTMWTAAALMVESSLLTDSSGGGWDERDTMGSTAVVVSGGGADVDDDGVL